MKKERNYEIYDKEMLAIMTALNKWWQYLMGALEDFEIWTDHQHLQYFRKPQKLNRRQAWWMTELAEYHYVLWHKPGKNTCKTLTFCLRQPDLKRGGGRQQGRHFCSKRSIFWQHVFTLKSLDSDFLTRIKTTKDAKGQSGQKGP